MKYEIQETLNAVIGRVFLSIYTLGMVSSETGAWEQIRPPEMSRVACFGLRRSDGVKDFENYFLGYLNLQIFPCL
jgi:hypothetical protein